MKHSICFLIVFIFFKVATSQISIEGHVIDNNTKTPIPYASVLCNDKIVVFSDENGYFKIGCNLEDLVKIRCVGYNEKTVLFSTIQKEKIVRLIELIIPLNEITVTAESAFSMLKRSCDSTAVHRQKSIQGICKRNDSLFDNTDRERSSEAIVYFESYIGNKGANSNYWLKSLNVKSSGEKTDFPYIAYPNSIPFNTFSIENLPEKKKKNIKFTISSSSDNRLIIKALMNEANVNLIKEIYYHIAKDSWIIERIEGKGSYWEAPIKKFNKYFYSTELVLDYQLISDSCLMQRMSYNLIFSNKREDINQKWNYVVDMDILHQHSKVSLKDTDIVLKKNSQYLLFRD